MKILKIIVISLMVLVLFSTAVASAEKVGAVVIDTEKIGAEWCVYCLTVDGNVWSFFDTEDYWQEGDELTLIFEGEKTIFAE